MRAKSLLINFLLTSVSLPHGDDARSLIARGMGYDNQAPGQQAQSDEPFFPIAEAVIFERDTRSGKNLLSILEAEAMFGEILSILRLIPLVFHSRPVVNVTRFVVTAKQFFS
jgi:hypothetical protein